VNGKIAADLEDAAGRGGMAPHTDTMLNGRAGCRRGRGVMSKDSWELLDRLVRMF
jgi:hypothetical protein